MSHLREGHNIQARQQRLCKIHQGGLLPESLAARIHSRCRLSDCAPQCQKSSGMVGVEVAVLAEAGVALRQLKELIFNIVLQLV